MGIENTWGNSTFTFCQFYLAFHNVCSFLLSLGLIGYCGYLIHKDNTLFAKIFIGICIYTNITSSLMLIWSTKSNVSGLLRCCEWIGDGCCFGNNNSSSKDNDDMIDNTNTTARRKSSVVELRDYDVYQSTTRNHDRRVMLHNQYYNTSNPDVPLTHPYRIDNIIFCVNIFWSILLFLLTMFLFVQFITSLHSQLFTRVIRYDITTNRVNSGIWFVKHKRLASGLIFLAFILNLMAWWANLFTQISLHKANLSQRNTLPPSITRLQRYPRGLVL